jgi:O-antigen/teichoic acid export membrane protein
MPLRKLVSRLFAYRPGRLAANTGLGLGWQLGRLATQAAWLILIARNFGADFYGTFVGVSNFASLIGGLSGLGIGLVLQQEVSRTPHSFGFWWRNARKLVVLSSLALVAVFAAITGPALQPRVDFTGIVLIGMSEIVMYPWVTLSAFAFAAHERFGWSAGLVTLTAVLRLIAVIIFVVAPLPRDMIPYLWLHLAASIAAAGVCVVAVQVLLKPGMDRGTLSASHFYEGLGFAAVWASGIAITAADKSLVFRLAGAQASGMYAAAYRFANVFAQPLDALVAAALPRLFRTGSAPAADNLLMRLVAATFGLSVTAAVALSWLCAIIPWLLGSEFTDAVGAARLLAWLLPFYGFRLLGTNVLVAGGNKRFRVAAELSAIVVMAVAGFELVPRHGVTGAAIMAIVTEAWLAALVWFRILLDRRSIRKHSTLENTRA